MSNTGLIIEERSRDIGDFLVGRIIPFRKKRMVGPFIFIDHMGPSQIRSNHYLDVGEHPHIGLSTLTYLFEGEIMHRDSIGTIKRISPGSVNWMTAGKGVVHTERTPEEQRDGGLYSLHGFQIWVALPKNLEDIAPSFYHADQSELPSWNQHGLDFTLIAGEGFGRKSTVPVYSPLFMIEVKSSEKTDFDFGDNLKGEIGICVVQGYIEACGDIVEKGNMLVSKDEDTCKLVIGEDTHLLIFGGEAFPEERYIYWNFVSSDKEKLEQAKKDWKEKRFDMVPEENDYIVMPEY